MLMPLSKQVCYNYVCIKLSALIICYVAAGNLNTSIMNQGGNASWPMAHLIYLTTNQSLTATDCTVFLQYFTFLSWTQLNDHAVEVASSLGFVSLPNSYHMYM